jgi:hypothetical protein
MQVFLSHSQQTSFVSEQARMDINKGETVLSTVRCLRDFFFATLQERNGNETACRQADKQTGVGHCRCHIFTQCQVRFKCAKDVTEMQIYRPRTAQTKAVYEMLLNRSPLSLESCRVMSSDVEWCRVFDSGDTKIKTAGLQQPLGDQAHSFEERRKTWSLTIQHDRW